MVRIWQVLLPLSQRYFCFTNCVWWIIAIITLFLWRTYITKHEWKSLWITLWAGKTSCQHNRISSTVRNWYCWIKTTQVFLFLWGFEASNGCIRSDLRVSITYSWNGGRQERGHHDIFRKDHWGVELQKEFVQTGHQGNKGQCKEGFKTSNSLCLDFDFLIGKKLTRISHISLHLRSHYRKKMSA